jgi:hypothetical protein
LSTSTDLAAIVRPLLDGADISFSIIATVPLLRA